MSETPAPENRIHFTFAVVNWNTMDLLDQCLASLIEESEGRFNCQILVADNGSSDASVAMLRRKYPQVELVELRENAGFAGGHYPLFVKSRGRYHVLVNSDVRLYKGCLATIFQRMEAEPDIGVLGPRIIGENEQTMPCCRRFPRLKYQFLEASGLSRLFSRHPKINAYHLGGFDHESSRDVDQVMGSFFVIRGSLLSLVGYLDRAFFMYYEEVDYCRRVTAAGYRVFYEADASIWHLGGGSANMVKTLTVRRSMRSMRHYFKKNHGGWTYFPLLLCVLLDGVTHVAYALARRHQPVATLKAYALAFWDVLVKKPSSHRD